MTARFYAGLPLRTGESLALPEQAARHVQVLRLQPGDVITLFNSEGGEYQAAIERMGRSDVQVTVLAHQPVECETRRRIHLAIGMPANERMDWLVEKASELGAASITPLMAERSVLRVKGERADKKRAHWQGIAVASCEQCGRNRVPQLHAVVTVAEWAAALPPASTHAPRLLLSLRSGSQPLPQAMAAFGSDAAVTLLSGPEGGLSVAEEALALTQGFVAVTLGPRTLRAETAPLAALVLLTQEG
jgi:16S rRNA (uracil1498-N3)-methyltransferase